MPCRAWCDRRSPTRRGSRDRQVTAMIDADGASGELYAERVEALSRATTRLRFDPYVDIDWDAPENVLDSNDPRWQLDPETDPLGATEWYAEQPLERRIEMG